MMDCNPRLKQNKPVHNQDDLSQYFIKAIEKVTIQLEKFLSKIMGDYNCYMNNEIIQ